MPPTRSEIRRALIDAISRCTEPARQTANDEEALAALLQNPRTKAQLTQMIRGYIKFHDPNATILQTEIDRSSNIHILTREIEIKLFGPNW
jgi:hypothetical protein